MHPVGEGGIPQPQLCGMAEHMAPTAVTSHVLTAWGVYTVYQAGPLGVALSQAQSEPAGGGDWLV